MSGPCMRWSTSWGKGWGSHSDPPDPAMLGGARASQEWAGGGPAKWQGARAGSAHELGCMVDLPPTQDPWQGCLVLGAGLRVPWQ